ncbi:MAG: hypothetical protein QNK37_36815 [Acidobacteriota bacterium]|nr:hypothetical protein [Acidobacteriota bacterium]
MTFTDWKITDTDIFMPLGPLQVAVTDDNHFFLLDIQGKYIQLFGRDGNHIDTLGGPGNGPDQIQSAIILYAHGNLVYVMDAFYVRVFDKTGFVRSFRKKGLIAAPVTGGLVWYDSDRWKNPGETNRMFFAEDHDFDRSRSIFEWTLPLGHQRKTLIKKGRKLDKTETAPPPATSAFAVSMDRNRVYFRPLGQSIVNIFNMGENTQRTIDLTGESASRLQVDALDYLWVYTKNGIKTFDSEGKPAKSPFSREAAGSVVKVDGDWAYVSLFDVGVEEAEIARIHLKDVAAFVAAHPISTNM